MTQPIESLPTTHKQRILICEAAGVFVMDWIIHALPIILVPVSDSPPRLIGEHTHHTNSEGKRVKITNENVYSLTYHKSTRRIICGEFWLLEQEQPCVIPTDGGEKKSS